MLLLLIAGEERHYNDVLCIQVSGIGIFHCSYESDKGHQYFDNAKVLVVHLCYFFLLYHG
jgi:hypothetical protein